MERVSITLAREFTALGLRVSFVVCRREGALLEEAGSVGDIIDLKSPRLRTTPIAFSRYLQSAKPDAALAFSWPLTSACVAGKFLARAKTRLVVSDRNNLAQAYRGRSLVTGAAMPLSMGLTYPRADGRIGISNGVADEMAQLARMDRAKFDVVYNPIPKPDPVKDLSAAEAAWGPRKGKRILTVGSFKPQKNHALLIRAFARLPADQGHTLMLLGEGGLRNEMSALANELDVSSRIRMPGFFRDPNPFYATSDLFVLSSDYEGFGNVVVEALGWGVPVVSTDCVSGPSEILGGGKYGLLTPVGDEQALASAIAKSLGMEHDKSALIARAAEFSPQAAAEKYLKLLFPQSSQALPAQTGIES
jgi:glycosyltransferase involved in cell wall biosynthesis